jgi:hypothetical protein
VLTTGGRAPAVAVMITSGHPALRMQVRVSRPQHEQARPPGALHEDPLRRSFGKFGGNTGGNLDAVGAAHDRGDHPLGPEPFLSAHRAIAKNGIGSAADGRLPGMHHVQRSAAEPGLGRCPAQRRQGRCRLVHTDDDLLRGRLNHNSLQTSGVHRTLLSASVRPTRDEGPYAAKITRFSKTITRHEPPPGRGNGSYCGSPRRYASATRLGTHMRHASTTSSASSASSSAASRARTQL